MTAPFRRQEVTPIPRERRTEYRSWLERNQVTDANSPESFYDYQGAFLAGLNRDETGHFPDTFKQHGHPTFSDESKYAAPNDPEAGYWLGETYVPPQQRYYRERPDVTAVTPRRKKRA